MQTVEVDKQADLQLKLEEIKTRAQVSKIGVFLCSHSVERIESWNTTAYAAKEEKTDGA